MKKQRQLEQNYLQPRHKQFISEYIKADFKGGEAYMKVYPRVKIKAVAEAAASRLLRNVKVQEEIGSRLNQSGITEAMVFMELWSIAKNHTDPYAAVRALALLAKSRGMLNPEKKRAFTDENPAIFLPILSREDIERITCRREELKR